MKPKRMVAMMALAGATALFAGGAAAAQDGVRPQTCAQVTPDANQWNYRLVALMQRIPQVQQVCVGEDVVPQQVEQATEDAMAALGWYR